MTRLPAPEQWVLSKMSEMETAEMIEEHIDFYIEDEDGNRNSVHLEKDFVKHFMRRYDEVQPTVVAIATAPIVLADGGLLAPDGLDRERGIFFVVPKELLAVIPKRKDCTPAAVQKAMKFLREEWLIDVKTDATGKSIIIALALTLIERSLLPNRPCFFVTAGRRGGGKTTTIQMLIKAVIGLMPASAAWSTDKEERRKALTSYFLSGVAYILWDNIPRGTQISCPHIELSCTSEFFADRLLGASKAVRVAAGAIHVFTGNAIDAKGELASRSLKVDLVVDRADPENRDFTHPDPIGWTENHRVEIMKALYTILLGNPELDQPADAAGNTRYKMWWRLVGSAVEHAAGDGLDFRNLFRKREEDDDEETASLADALAVLRAKVWPKGFTASAVAELINCHFPEAEDLILRGFLFPDSASEQKFTPEKVAAALKAHLNNPVKHGEDTLVLRRQQDDHAKVFIYRVDKIESGPAPLE